MPFFLENFLRTGGEWDRSGGENKRAQSVAVRGMQRKKGER